MGIDVHCRDKSSRDNGLEAGKEMGRAMELRSVGLCFAEHHSVRAFRATEKIAIPEKFLARRIGALA